MVETGIEEILNASLGSVLKMRRGMKRPQNVRAFRKLVAQFCNQK